MGKEKDLRLKEAEPARVLSSAESFLEQEGQEEKAADLYLEAANLTRGLGRKELAEKYVERAKRNSGNQERKWLERIEEEKKKRELEQKRRTFEDQRSQSIAQAEKMMEIGKFREAAKFYEIAGDASAGLGEKAISQEFKSNC